MTRNVIRKERICQEKKFQDYEEYVWSQTDFHRSFESDNEKWVAGQRRFIELFFPSALPKASRILDIACGDGVGLEALGDLGFSSVIGVDFCDEKLQRAREKGFAVCKADMHNLSMFRDSSFDVVYSSHSLEHCLYPDKAVLELVRVARPGAVFIVVVPYPGEGAYSAHCGCVPMQLHVDDQGESTAKWFRHFGVVVEEIKQDSFREDELWLRMRIEKEIGDA